MWIKICGNTRLEDCQSAAELGADAVGFVFAEGRRTVTASEVAAITSHLPGVFTSHDPEEIVHTAQHAGLTGVQLHGPPDLRLTRAVRERFNPRGLRRIVQVLHWWTDVSPEKQQEAFATEVEAVANSGESDALLFDSHTQSASGGTGITFDWTAAKSALTGLRVPVIVAGGLRPENVADAIHTLQPFGVDVASGVELTPGVKDADKLREFIRAARSAI
jgi:phosphoribosylanthranilate isomerase